MKPSIKALVLLSGGQDSATCLAEACNDYPSQVAAVIVNYGQRHQIEIEFAKQLCSIANIPFKEISLNWISEITKNALTDNTKKIEQSTGQLPTTFVPGRNLLFLVTAAVYAYDENINLIYTGVCQTDYSGYPDCREEFIKSTEKTLQLAMERPIKIKTPLMHLTKSETVLKMKELGKLEWYKWTHTCYEGSRPACGVCPACQLRLKGFQEAGIKDLIAYKI